MKAWIRHAEAEAETLEDVLTALVGDVRIVLLHYAPIPDTLDGERLELYPSSATRCSARLSTAWCADLVLHGHAHHGSLAGTTHGGVPVRNVAQSVIRGPYVVFTIEREDEDRPGRSLRRWRDDGDADTPAPAGSASAGADGRAGCGAAPVSTTREHWTEGQAPLSRSSPAPALVATLHDPRGAFLPLIDLDLEAVATALGRTHWSSSRRRPPLMRVTDRLEQLGALIVPGGRWGGSPRRADVGQRRSARLFLP